MKTKTKLSVFIVSAFIFSNNCFSQSTSASNALSGTAPNPTQFLGSSNGFNVLFKANNIERMRILQSNGNVGIGNTNTNPLAPLHVLGDNSFPQLKISTTGTGNAVYGAFLSIDGTASSGGKDWLLFSTGGSAGEGTGKLVFKNQTDNKYALTLTSTGDIGIGTNNPVSTVELNRSTGLFQMQFKRSTLNVVTIGSGNASTGLFGILDLYNNSQSTPDIHLLAGNSNCWINSGNVGIGTSTPTQKFDVNGFAHFTYNSTAIPASNSQGGLTIGYNRSNGGAEVNFYNVFENADPVNLPTTAFQFSQKNGANSVNNLMTIKSNGCVGIGTDLTSATYDNTFKLAVNGKIRAKEVVVETGWSDFVFEKNYKLNTLEEVNQYIKANGHLPGIPSAKEIETNGGNIGELLKLQMQKIEELTLYMIDMEKQINDLKGSK